VPTPMSLQRRLKNLNKKQKNLETKTPNYKCPKLIKISKLRIYTKKEWFKRFLLKGQSRFKEKKIN
jgi:hypothetical protein